MRLARLFLIAILLLDVWYRSHTFGPTVARATGLRLWPAAVGESEPLDCDEAAYAYIGHRMLQGDVLYRDLTENKPPLGYWLYAAAVAIGGYRETAIRLMPIPAVLVTISLLWWIALRLAGPPAACVAAFTYVLLSTDPFLFGNGSNMEHFMNLFSTVSLAFFVLGWDRKQRWPLAAAGLSLGAAVLVKQVAILPAAVYAAALLLRRKPTVDSRANRPLISRLADLIWLGVGLASITGLAAAILVAQGAGGDAYEDIFRYGRALATDTLPEPGAPSGLVRWLTGNADPTGRLPWPFGDTTYLVWWGTGSWPLWLAAVPCGAYLLLAPRSAPLRRVVAAWSIAAGAQVVLPGLYWQHYYLLPTPGIALVVAITLADAVRYCLGRPAPPSGRRARVTIGGATVGLLAAAILATLVIQIRAYLLVPPEQLTIRYKGGAQWVVLRFKGAELERRSTVWRAPLLYIWGWQAPLHFYGKLDGATRHFFVDNLLRDQAGRDHPLIKPRIDEIVAALRARPPALIFVGYPPFPELKRILFERYLPSRLFPAGNGMGLWVDREKFAEFETFNSSARTPLTPGRPAR